MPALEQQHEQGLTSDHSSLGGFGDRRACLRLGARNCCPYCCTIAAAGFRRIPTAPRSSTKAHSAAIRLTTSSAVIIGGIPLPPPSVRRHAFASFGLAFVERFREVVPRDIGARDLARGEPIAQALPRQGRGGGYGSR